MGHRHRTALFDLLFKERDHGPVASQYISEPHGHKVRLRPGVHHLHHHLAHPLGRPHDVGGVHGLVRGDQHETTGSIFIRRLCRLICTEHVVLDGLVGAVLHEGHMLVGRRMVHDVGTVFLKHRLDPVGVPDRADEHHQVQVRILFLQLQLDVIGVVFVNIKDN